MFKNDPNMEYYERKYESELIDFLERVVTKVDDKIRRSMNRLDAPIPENLAKSISDRMNQPNEVRDNLMDQIANLNDKINYYLEQAERKGEDGLIDESEALFKEIEDMKSKKAELETQLEMNMSKKQMAVCEICGAMQAATDTDKRLTTHLEGKLHMGFAKIRNCMAELKDKQEEHKRKRVAEGKRERTPSPAARRKRRDYDEQSDFDPTKLIRAFSSIKFGTGVNMPDLAITSIKYASSALECNKYSIGVPVVAPDFEAMRAEKERKRIDWEREHGYQNGKPPRGGGFDNDRGGRGGGFRGRGRGGVGFSDRGGRRDFRGGGGGGDRFDRGGGNDRFDRGGGNDRNDRGGGGGDRFDSRRRERGGFDRERRRY
jgi:hypothetical protein